MFKDFVIYTPMYVTGFWALVLILSSINKNKAKEGLGVFMFLAFGLYLSHAIYFKYYVDIYLFFDPIYIITALSVYPMYYWYIKLLTVEPEFKMQNLVYFLPAIFLGIASAIIYIFMSEEERVNYLQVFLFRNQGVQIDSTLVDIQKAIYYLSRIVFMIQILFVLMFGRKLVIEYNGRISNFYSDLESRSLVWVNWLLYSFFVISIMSMVFNILGRSVFSHSSVLLLIPSLIFSVLLFLIGFQGSMQNHTVDNFNNDELLVNEIDIKNHNRSILKENLIDLFENQKIYRQTDLKITNVSLLLQTNRTYVSSLINTDFDSTFNEFVNRYRIIEVKKILQNTNHHNLSLDFVAESAGFGSMSSFIRIFNKSEGITPGKYRDMVFINKNSLQQQ